MGPCADDERARIRLSLERTFSEAKRFGCVSELQLRGGEMVHDVGALRLESEGLLEVISGLGPVLVEGVELASLGEERGVVGVGSDLQRERRDALVDGAVPEGGGAHEEGRARDGDDEGEGADPSAHGF